MQSTFTSSIKRPEKVLKLPAIYADIHSQVFILVLESLGTTYAGFVVHTENDKLYKLFDYRTTWAIKDFSRIPTDTEIQLTIKQP